jgi:hypothetical protein
MAAGRIPYFTIIIIAGLGLGSGASAVLPSDIGICNALLTHALTEPDPKVVGSTLLKTFAVDYPVLLTAPVNQIMATWLVIKSERPLNPVTVFTTIGYGTGKTEFRKFTDFGSAYGKLFPSWNPHGGNFNFAFYEHSPVSSILQDIRLRETQYDLYWVKRPDYREGNHYLVGRRDEGEAMLQGAAEETWKILVEETAKSSRYSPFMLIPEDQREGLNLLVFTIDSDPTLKSAMIDLMKDILRDADVSFEKFPREALSDKIEAKERAKVLKKIFGAREKEALALSLPPVVAPNLEERAANEAVLSFSEIDAIFQSPINPSALDSVDGVLNIDRELRTGLHKLNLKFLLERDQFSIQPIWTQLFEKAATLLATDGKATWASEKKVFTLYSSLIHDLLDNRYRDLARGDHTIGIAEAAVQARLELLGTSSSLNPSIEREIQNRIARLEEIKVELGLFRSTFAAETSRLNGIAPPFRAVQAAVGDDAFRLADPNGFREGLQKVQAAANLDVKLAQKIKKRGLWQ